MPFGVNDEVVAKPFGTNDEVVSGIQTLNPTQPSFGRRVLNVLNAPTPEPIQRFLDNPLVRLPRVDINDPRINVTEGGAGFFNKMAEDVEGLTTLPNVAATVLSGGENILARFLRPALLSLFGTKAVSEQLPQAVGQASVVLDPRNAPSFTSAEKGASLGGTVDAALMSALLAPHLAPMGSLRAPPQGPTGVPPTRFTPNMELLRQGLTPQDIQEMGKAVPAERQLMSEDQAQSVVDRMLQNAVQRAIQERSYSLEGRPVRGERLRLPGEAMPPERQLTYGGPPPEPTPTVVQRPQGEGQPIFRMGPQVDPSRLLAERSVVPERQIAPEAPLNWPDRPPGTGEGKEIREGFGSMVRLQGIRPAVRTMDGKVHIGNQGDVHNDIIKRDKIEPTNLDRRMFVDATGVEISRERLAQMGVPETGAVPGAHADELARQQEKGKTSETQGQAQEKGTQRVLERPTGKGLQLKATEAQRRQRAQEGAINLQGPAEVLASFKAKLVDGTQVVNRLRNKLHPDEWKIYEDMGIVGAFGGKKVDPKEVATWMQDNGPKVEVRELGAEGGSTPEEQQAARLRHSWYDLLEQKSQSIADGYVNNINHPDIQYKILQDFAKENGLTEPQAKSELDKWVQYRDISRRGNESATARYTMVNPKPLAEMPGAVDLLVRLPTQEHPLGGNVNPKYSSPHYPTEGKNLVAHVRGYMETTPDGKKVFHVFEVQSDWAQQVRESKERFRGNYPESPESERERLMGSRFGPPDHPLLRHYERLALKAAIEHAKKNGADAIALSDAETAMMTEGHDLVANRVNVEGAQTEYFDDDFEAQQRVDELAREGIDAEVGEGNEQGYPVTWLESGGYDIPQEPGMRLHYDQTLPKILKELTGSEGERVSFGEHQNAFEQGTDYVTLRNPETGEEISPTYADAERERARGFTEVVQGELYSTARQRKRSNLIFREPSGEPKTSITARMYPLKDVGTDFTMFGKDRPKAAESKPQGLQLKPTPEQLKRRGQEGAINVEAIRDKFKQWLDSGKSALDRPIGWSPDQVKNKAERAKIILSNPRAKPLESREQFRAQPGETTSVRQTVVNKVRSAQDAAGKVDKMLLPIDVIIDDLDGGKADYKGPLMQQVRWTLDDDFNNELGMRESLTDPVVKLVKEGKLNKKNSERIAVYAEAQQEGGRQRMVDSGVSPAKIDQILKSMTPQELSVYREMRKQLDGKLAAVQKLAKDLYGTVVNPVKNYFPRQRQWELYEPEAEQIAGPRQAGEATPDFTSWRELNQDYTQRGTKAEQGFTVQRKPKAKTPIKLDAFTVYDRHMKDVAHFLSMQKNLKEIGEIVRSDDFKDKYGDRGQKQLVDWLNVVAKQGRYKRNAVLDTVRRNVARGIIAFRIPSQLVHLSNVPLAMERAGPVWYGRGQEALFTDEGQAFLKQHFREVFERGGGEEALQEATRGPITKAGFWLQREMDRINAQATVLGVYMRRLQEKGLDPQQYDTLPVDKDAVREARVLARRAVASPLYKDVPLALTKGGSGAKFFFQFQNTFLDQWSNIRYDLVQAGLGKTLLNNPKLVSRMALAVTLMALTETGIKYGYTEAKHSITGRHPKDEETFSGKLLHEALRRIPGMGQLMSAIEYGETGVPGADVAKEVIGSGKKAVQAESKGERLLAAEKVLTSVMELGGVPGASQAGEVAQEYTKAQVYKSHQKRLEDLTGKPVNKMTLDERVKAERQLKTERGPQSRSDEAKGVYTAKKNEAKRGAELQKALDPKIQEWLDKKGYRIPGFPDTLPYQKEHLVLTEAETKRYKELLTDKYNKFLSSWVGTSPTKERLSARLEQAHAQARTQLLNEIRSNSILESDEGKTKKRRFSFMGSE
jgi:hypothetical protein